MNSIHQDKNFIFIIIHLLAKTIDGDGKEKIVKNIFNAIEGSESAFTVMGGKSSFEGCVGFKKEVISPRNGSSNRDGKLKNTIFHFRVF